MSWQALHCLTNVELCEHRFAMLAFSKTRNWVYLSQHSALIWSCLFVSSATGICSASCCTHMPLQTNFGLSLRPLCFPASFLIWQLSSLPFPGTQQYHKSWRNLHGSSLWCQHGMLLSIQRPDQRCCQESRQCVLRGHGAWAKEGNSLGSIAIVYDFIPCISTMEWLREQTSILDGRQTNLFVCCRFYRPVLLYWSR